MSRARTAVIGLGNVVMSDDGLGMHALARLRARLAPHSDVTLVEGGTGGLLLLPHLVDTQRAIIIDAVDTGAPPGTLVRLTGYAVARAFAAGTTAHEVGLRDLLGVALLTGAWPEVLVLHGAQPAGTSPGAELTPVVAAALDPLVDVVMVDLSYA